MEKKKINILDQIGKSAISRSLAAEIRAEVVGLLRYVPTIELDFAGVELLTHSFGDELVAVLVEQFGKDWFKEHIRVTNLSEQARASLNEALHWRLHERKVPTSMSVTA